MNNDRTAACMTLSAKHCGCDFVDFPQKAYTIFVSIHTAADAVPHHICCTLCAIIMIQSKGGIMI